MPSALIGTNLVDSLIGVVDSLRSDLYPAMGVRQYNVRLIRRAWSGGAIGNGTPAEVSNILLSPQPSVSFGGNDDRLDANAGCGRVATGVATLTEVSLTFTEAELFPLLSDGEDFVYEISDAQGQGIAPTYWIPTHIPTPDREQSLGWIVSLRRYERTV